VALKVIRGGAHVDEHHIKLFQREVQTLAKLRHPGIATIFDSGVTDDGQHYFAMELVRGQTLSEYARQHEAVRDRLAVFLKICQAVAYAHQRGVIHRDLKPTNILVEPPRTPSGSGSLPGVGAEVKVLDFGLARLVDTEGSLSSMLSEVGTIRGTLPYMSPEQVRGHTDQIDVRTDVYALGVILYELLTGRLPYDLTKAGLPELARIITEEPPAPLSRSFSGTRRPGADLTTILFKALEKEPGRRYRSAAALAEDVERYLSDQPILARPPSAAYQARKLVSRHRYLFGSIAAAFVVLVAFAAHTWVQSKRIAREADTSRQVSDFLVEMFETADPSKARGATITAREILDAGARKLESGSVIDPSVRGKLQIALGNVYRELGLFDRADPTLASALELRRQTDGDSSLAYAEALEAVGRLHYEQGRLEDAIALQSRTLAIRERLLDDDDVRVGWAHYYLGASQVSLGHVGEGLPHIARASAIFEQTIGPESQAVAWCLTDTGVGILQSGNLEEGLTYMERAYHMKRKVLPPDHPDVLSSMNNVGYLLTQLGRYDEARPYLEEALSAHERVNGPEHKLTLNVIHSLGDMWRLVGDYERAKPLLERAVDGYSRAVGPEHIATAILLRSLALLLTETGEHDRADALFRRALAIQQSVQGADSADSIETLEGYATLLRRMGRTEEAVRREAQARTIQEHLGQTRAVR